MLFSLSSRALRLHFENSVGRILEHPAGYVVVEYAAGKRRFEDTVAFLTRARDLLQHRSWHKVLGDQRHMTAFTEEERHWLNQNWLNTKTVTGRPYYGAVLLSHDVFARLAMSLVVSEARESGMIYRLFEDEDAAAAWLRELS